MVLSDKIKSSVSLIYFYFLAPLSIIALTQCTSSFRNRLCNLYPHVISNFTRAYLFPNIVPYFFFIINSLPILLHKVLIVNGYISIVAIILKIFYNRSKIHHLLFADNSLLKGILIGSVLLAAVSETGYLLQIIEIVQVLGFGFLFQKLRTNRFSKLRHKLFVFGLLILSIINLIQAFRNDNPAIYSAMGRGNRIPQLEDRSSEMAFMLM